MPVVLPDEHTLTKLGAVIHLSDLVGMGYTAGSARVVANRWSSRGWLAPVGDRTGLYRNNTRHSEGDSWQNILRCVCPDTVVCGVTALAYAGCLEDTDGIVELAIPHRTHIPQLLLHHDQLRLHRRTKRWFNKVTIIKDENRLWPRLTVLDALADMMAHNDPRHGILEMTLPEELDINDYNRRAKVIPVYDPAVF